RRRGPPPCRLHRCAGVADSSHRVGACGMTPEQVNAALARLRQYPEHQDAVEVIEALRAEADSLRIEIEGCGCPAPYGFDPRVDPLIYVAGPISKDPLGCVSQAMQAFEWLRPRGAIPFLPQLSVVGQMVSPQD